MNLRQFLLPLTLSLLGACAPLERYEFSQKQMGTLMRVVLYAPDPVTADAAAQAAAARVEQLNKALSDYDPNSELSRLSQTAGTGVKVPVSDELWEMLVSSRRIAEQTDGAFDITIGPAVELWRRARRTGRLPEPEKLALAMASVGYQHILLDPAERTAQLNVPGMKLDLGGIAKGYAADQAMEVLHAHGITRALVAMGGDIVVSDPPPGKKGWTVEIKPFGEQSTSNTRHLLLVHSAVSTSGDAFQHVVIAGQRYSHIVDPATGLGLTTPMGVTVVSRHGTLSDAYATAIAVLGPERGFRVIDTWPGAAAIIVQVDEKGEVRTHESGGVKRLKFVNP